MAEYSQPSSELSYTLGREEAIILRNIQLQGEETFRIQNIVSNAEVIPEHRNAGNQVEIFVHSDLSAAGNYTLNWGGNAIQPLAFNFNRAESYNETMAINTFKEKLAEQRFSNWSLLEGDLETVSAGAGSIDDSHKYWLSLLVWALIFLAIEILLIKFWR
jgi:hypothetical protein